MVLDVSDFFIFTELGHEIEAEQWSGTHQEGQWRAYHWLEGVEQIRFFWPISDHRQDRQI